MNTKELSQKEYPSKYYYKPQEYIKMLVNLDERYFPTVVDLQGRAGEPIYKGTEVIF